MRSAVSPSARGAFVLATAGIVTIAAGVLPFAVDDAFIVFRYAENLASGGGWAMNAGTPTDGVTGPLWVLPSLVAIWAGGDPLTTSRVVGVTACALSALLVVRRVAGRSGGRSAAWATAVLMAMSPHLAIWSVAGLETGLATLLTTTAALGATARPRALPWQVGLSVAGLAWLRPELALICLAILSVVSVRDRRAGLIAFSLGALGALSVVAFRLWMFGDALPLSFYAKPADVSLGASYALRGVMVMTGLGGLLLAGLGAVHGRRDDRALGLSLVAHAAAVALGGGDWMPGFRLLAPVIPIYALLAGIGFSRARRSRAVVPRRLVAPIALAAALVVSGLDTYVQVPRARDAGEIRVRDGAALARRLTRHGTSVALVDIGYLGFASGLEVVDLGGVTDPVVAHARGDHTDKIIDVGYLSARDPDLVVFTSQSAPVVDGAHVRLRGAMPVEYRLAASAWLSSGYRVLEVAPYGEALYVVLGRRERP